ncbi:hypothetical protein K491DRAFT_551946, partial [Lophiostoma macrostomum CBS 122681]
LPASAYEGLGLSASTVKTLTKPQDAPASAASPNVLQAQPQSARDLAMNESSITLYAELLLNIRTVTLFASLRTVHTRETKATLSTNGDSITISHEGASATIHLPVNAGGGGDAALALPASPPSKELSLRLQIEEQDDSELFTGVHTEERKANIVPWDGASLNEMKNVRILCKSCQSLAIDGAKVVDWRDLPNENWAEMMDFWHCHKPDEHHLHDHTHHDAVAKKGYAAGNQFKATEGIGFVDLSSLLLAEADCAGADPESSHNEMVAHALVCKTCDKNIGYTEPSSGGWRIRKWYDKSPSIATSPDSATPPSPPPSTYSTQKWISARLLSLIENLGIRKFHVHPPTSSPSTSSSPTELSSTPANPTPSLLLWVFTPDLLFSSSIPSPRRHDPTRAMKIFYQRRAWKELAPGEPEEVGVEVLELDAELYSELETGLEEGRKLLPVGARTFKEWEVGLLDRFDVAEVRKGGSNGN